MEDLICEVYGPAEGRGILSGRAELLEQRRTEAANGPAAPSARPMPRPRARSGRRRACRSSSNAACAAASSA